MNEKFKEEMLLLEIIAFVTHSIYTLRFIVSN